MKSEKSKCFIVIEFLSVECFAKIMQIECRTSSLLECYAEMQLILCKDNANERNESLLSDCRVQLILCKDKKKIWKTNEMRTKIFERKFPVGQFTASN